MVSEGCERERERLGEGDGSLVRGSEVGSESVGCVRERGCVESGNGWLVRGFEMGSESVGCVGEGDGTESEGNWLVRCSEVGSELVRCSEVGSELDEAVSTASGVRLKPEAIAIAASNTPPTIKAPMRNGLRSFLRITGFVPAGTVCGG